MIPSATRNQSIDALRGLAVLLVVAFHMRPDGFQYGYVGVDAFFVIAGWFIGQKTIEGDENPSRYLKARAYRLVPETSVFLIVTLGLGYLLLPPGEYSKTSASVFVSGLYLYDLLPLSIDYFGQGVFSLDTPHLWSLGVEIKAFLIFSSLLLVPHAARPILIMLIGVVSLSVLLLLDPGYHNPVSRLWQFAAGALIAGREKKHGIAAVCLLSAGTGAAFLSSSLSVASAAASLVTGLCLFRPAQKLPTLLLPVAWIGTISFGLYLWHWLAIRYGYLAFGRTPGVFVEASILTLSIGFAYLSRSLVEFRLGNRLRKLDARAPLLGLALLPVLLSFTAISGAPGRLSSPASLSALEQVEGFDLRDCHRSDKLAAGVERCVFGDEMSNLALIGDSHAVALSHGLRDLGLSFRDYAMNGCPISRTASPISYPHCAELHRAAIDAVLTDTEVATVILHFRWMKAGTGDVVNRGYRDLQFNHVMQDASGLRMTKGEVLAMSTEEIELIVRELRAAGKRVILVGQVPVYGFDVGLMAMARDLPLNIGLAISELTIDRAYLEQRFEPMRKVLTRTRAEFIDPLDLFCDVKTCDPIQPEGLMVIDQDHLSLLGARRLAKRIVDAKN